MMKTGLQKHTSKFVAGLFNSLGIIACVSLTSCGDKNKDKQTENQSENVKDVQLTTSDPQPNPDDEKQKEINKWLTKLNDLNETAFTALGNDLKGKVAQKFIDNKIDVANVSAIKEKLAGFINEVVVKKKESEITLKIEKGGKVTIAKVANNETIDFVFDKIENFQSFVQTLEGKDITNEEVELSFAFAGENVKICDHQTGFKVTDCFDAFLNCLNTLVRFEKLNVPKLSLNINEGKLYLNNVECSDAYFKEVAFWNMVQDHAALFGITDDNQFEIEKEGDDGNATVKVGEFKTQLKWSDVVENENTFKADSGWDKIFKIKNEAEAPKTKEVTVKFEDGKCSCSEIEAYKNGVELNSLDVLGQLVEDLKAEKVTIGEKKNFSLAFEGKNVKVCGNTNGFEVMKGADFATLLGHVKNLKDVNHAIDAGFHIKIEVADANIKLNGEVVDLNFMQTQDFWDAVAKHKDLFDGLPIIVVKKDEGDKHVKIGSLVLNFDVLAENDGEISEDWKEIFKINVGV